MSIKKIASLTSDEDVLVSKEAQRLLRCSRGVFYRGIKNGTIPSIRLGPEKNRNSQSSFNANASGRYEHQITGYPVQSC